MRHLSAAAIAGVTILFLLFSASTQHAQRPALLLNDQEYFAMPGLNVMAFQDIYPEGHQSGVVIIQNGVRVSTNGDLRLDPTPDQWQPMAKQDKRVVNKQGNEITTWLSYPDPGRSSRTFRISGNRGSMCWAGAPRIICSWCWRPINCSTGSSDMSEGTAQVIWQVRNGGFPPVQRSVINLDSFQAYIRWSLHMTAGFSWRVRRRYGGAGASRPS